MEETVRIPQLLWKYRKWNSHTRSLVVNGSLYFNEAKLLNDPFEFRWRQRIPTLQEEIVEFAKELCALNFPKHSIEQRRAQFDRIVNELTEKASILGNNTELAHINRNMGVFCASEHSDDVLMWSHYGDEHKGVCVGLSPRKVSRQFRPVEYLAEIPVIDAWHYVRNPDDIFSTLACCKADNWRYEREWRSIFLPGMHSFPECVQQVVIGARASTETQEDVLEAIETASQNVSVHYASLSDTHYRIDVNPDVVTVSSNK